MELTPWEKDKLPLGIAALPEERRKARGSRLSYLDAVAGLPAAIMEGARDGRSGAGLMSHCTTPLTRQRLLNRAAGLIPEIPVEATLCDGIKPMTVSSPDT